MIGLAVTCLFGLVLWGFRSKLMEKKDAFRRFMLGEEKGKLRQPWQELLVRFFTFEPAQSIPLLAGVFLVPLLSGGIIGAVNHSVWWLAAGGLAALAAPWTVYTLRVAGWKKKCRTQMKETLRNLSTAIRSGQTFAAAMGRAALDVAAPFHDLLLQVEKEIRIGAPEGEAFQRLVEQTGIASFDTIALLIAFTLAKGGNLAYVLDDIAATLEEEEELLADLRSETASYRMSAYGLPFILIGLLFFFRSTITPLFAQSGFVWVFIGALLAMSIGILLTFRIVRKLEV